MKRRDHVWPYLICLLGAASALLVVLGLQVAPRASVVLAFACVCPGMALIRLLRIDNPVPELLLAVVVSLALSAVLATVSIYAGMWDPKITLLALVEVSIVAVLVDLRRPERPRA